MGILTPQLVRALLLRDILNEVEIQKLAVRIEETDNTTIKGLEEIFKVR